MKVTCHGPRTVYPPADGYWLPIRVLTAPDIEPVAGPVSTWIGQSNLLLFKLFQTDSVCLQVAENLLNPFGGDDADFEINPLIEDNLQVRIHTNKNKHVVRGLFT